MADTQRIYPKVEQTFSNELKRLKNWDISNRNKDLIHKFHNSLFSDGTGELRVSKLSGQLRRITSYIKKDLDCLDIEDIQNIVAYYNTQKTISDATKADYRIAIKQFYAWYEDFDNRKESETKKFYKYVKSLKRTYKIKKADFNEIINDTEIKIIIEKGCTTIRDKAFIKLLHESGFRAGEILNIKFKDIIIQKNRCIITVDGKTGVRSVPIINSLPYLVQWIDLHPFKENREAYLWICQTNSHMFKPLKHRGAAKLVDRCILRANLKHKRHNLHWFRHSRATLLAPRITEAILCKYMGWVLGSKQVRRYVHMCNDQLNDAIMQMNGLVEKEEVKHEKPQECICGTINPETSRYCYKCGNPLDVLIMIQDKEIVKEQVDERLKVYAEIMSDPIKKKKFEEFKALMFNSS